MARNLTPGHLILLASPAYLRDKPPIRHPGDLGGFDGIRIRSPQTGRVRSWPLRRRNGEEAPIELRERMTMSDPEATCEVAAMGLGITLVCMQHAYAYLESGALVRVLPDWYVDAGNTSLYYAANKLLPAKTGSSSTSSSTTSAARTWPGASPPSQPASASHPSLRQPGKGLAPASPENGSLTLPIGTLVLENAADELGRCLPHGPGTTWKPCSDPAHGVQHARVLGVSLPSRPLLLKLGLLSLPWALCAGLHAVGLGVWLALALGWFASLAMLFLLLRDPRQAVANASPQADAASPAWSAAQRALADETAQLDGHARQIDELLHSAIRQLSDSFHGLAERIDTQRGLSHSLIERYDGRGQVDEGINFQDFVRTTQQTLSLFVEATLETSRTSQQLVERMDQVRLKITEILQSTQDMDAIAKQTNLLALNAAIEAARAGERRLRRGRR